MNTSDFDYDLPPAYIAQFPIEPRDSARLLVIHRDDIPIKHSLFRDIGTYLQEGDLLVLNQTRVIPARIFARKQTGGRVEILLLKKDDDNIWEVLVGGKSIHSGAVVDIEYGGNSTGQGDQHTGRKSKPIEGTRLRGEVIDVLDGSRRRICFSQPLEPLFKKIGHVPLPPYIHERLSDPERYQTVFARQPGSVAAPTAGLHFTPGLFRDLERRGVKIAFITLHIGLDTFAPVTEDDPMMHKIHTETCEISENTAMLVNQTVQKGGRVIAVGTTSVRTLESAVSKGKTVPYLGETNLFILPGYRFKVVNGIVTNFHLPRSTLIMLVSAFAGRRKILDAYEIAKQKKYRFYSFGDAMLIL